jgi:hypothetical protein
MLSNCADSQGGNIRCRGQRLLFALPSWRGEKVAGDNAWGGFGYPTCLLDLWTACHVGRGENI